MLPHIELTSSILKSCFDVMNELGPGFLESVYKNALFVSLKEKRLTIEIEKPFEIYFKSQKIGFYKADMGVENLIIVELKCCQNLLPEHQAQVINYLAASNLPIGLLVNFHSKRIQYKRMHHPSFKAKNDVADPLQCHS